MIDDDHEEPHVREQCQEIADTQAPSGKEATSCDIGLGSDKPAPELHAPEHAAATLKAVIQELLMLIVRQLCLGFVFFANID